MEAYAVLDGGGVKGAALAGCLKAAEEQGIQFQGYGGTSAGALVATLAAVGYTPDELKAVLSTLRFDSLLDDQGKALVRLKALPHTLIRPWHWISNYLLVTQVIRDLGLYQGALFRKFVRTKIADKIPALLDKPDITFEDLKEHHCKPLKIVVTDLGSREPRIYSAAGGREHNGSVLDAVRASASYPFVFMPVRMNERYLVDGGLCSNLPIFLFERERASRSIALIAFDLVQPIVNSGTEYRFSQFCGDMMASALESGDFLLRSVVRNVHHVQVRVPPDIDTLDFGIDASQTEVLYNAGLAAAHSFFARIVPQWAQARNQVERVQAQTGVSNALVSPVLEAIKLEFERKTSARHVRVSVSMPLPNGMRGVIYQFGMDNDPDSDLELEMTAGCSGRAWSTKRPTAADLQEAKGKFAEQWHMTKEQQNKVAPDRKSMMSFPVFDLTNPHAGKSVDELPLIGILSVDSDTLLPDTGWTGAHSEDAVRMGTCWADVLSRLLT